MAIIIAIEKRGKAVGMLKSGQTGKLHIVFQ